MVPVRDSSADAAAAEGSTNSVNLNLESTDALGPNGLWKAVATPPSPSGPFQSLLLPVESGDRYFRLRQP